MKQQQIPLSAVVVALTETRDFCRLVVGWGLLTKEVVVALTETRDFCRSHGDESGRTTLTIDAEGEWEFTTGVGNLVEPHGHADEWGSRSYTLPIVQADWSDEDIGQLARAWADGEYTEEFRFPSSVEITRDEHE